MGEQKVVLMLTLANALLKRETGPMDVSLNLYMKRWEAKEGVER